MRLLVLAGGLGTRLRTAVGGLPKALAPVAGAPFLFMQLQHWRAQGIRQFSFLLHHQAEQIISFVDSVQATLLADCHVDWLVEPIPMDTGGAIANAVREFRLSSDFLVTNADTWLGTGMGELMRSSSPAMAVLHRTDVGRYGQVEFDAHFHVVRFAEKNGASIPGWINAGIFRLNAGLFGGWDGRPLSLERALFAELTETRRLKAVPLQTDFLDIGVPDDYHRFCRWVESGRKAPL